MARKKDINKTTKLKNIKLLFFATVTKKMFIMQKERINNRKQKQQKIKGFLYVKKSCDSCNNNNDDDIDVDDKIYKIEMKKRQNT